MATFDDRSMVEEIIKNNGWLDEFNSPEDRKAPDNPPAVKIVEYTTPEGNPVWGIVFANEVHHPDVLNRYEQETFYVRNPHVIWERKDDPQGV